MKCLYLQFCKLFSIAKTSGLREGNRPYITIRKDLRIQGAPTLNFMRIPDKKLRSLLIMATPELLLVTGTFF